MQNRKECLYVRVSTDNQQGGLESQIRALKDWCSRNEIFDYELFTDEGISGAKESRPSLNRLMQLVEQNRVEQVIVFSFSRFARSTSHLLKALKTFKEKNTRFISITESIDTNSTRYRNSALIESLLEAGLSFREISKIAKCSHGSVSAQKKEWLRKKSDAEQLKLNKIADQIRESQNENPVEQMKSMNLNEAVVLKVQEKIEKDARENVRSILGQEAYDTYD